MYRHRVHPFGMWVVGSVVVAVLLIGLLSVRTSGPLCFQHAFRTWSEAAAAGTSQSPECTRKRDRPLLSPRGVRTRRAHRCPTPAIKASFSFRLCLPAGRIAAFLSWILPGDHHLLGTSTTRGRNWVLHSPRSPSKLSTSGAACISPMAMTGPSSGPAFALASLADAPGLLLRCRPRAWSCSCDA